MHRVWRVVACAAFAALSCQCANAAETQAGLDMVIITGTHTETFASATGSAPAPLVHVSERIGRFEIAGEGIPPLGNIPVAANDLGLSNVNLSYFNAVIRYRVTDTTAIGIGETLYNQQSTYVTSFETGFGNPALQTEIDSSRVAGVQYSIVQTLRQSGRSSLTLRFGVNPHLSANLHHAYKLTFSGGRIIPIYPSPTTDSEAGSQIDAELTDVVRIHRTLRLEYGIRYLNMTMLFADKSLADRNAFLIPFVGLSAAVGI